ncbi:MAG: hypothetical protein DRI80_05170 [Chloroflexota bacterium]|nr:MAG: hypothetical protein DRI80_05170 [Chloroflexota bacterium]
MIGITEQLQALLTEAISALPGLIAAVVVFILTWFVAGFVARIVRRAARVRIRDPETVKLLGLLAYWSVVAIGTVTALGQTGFDVTGFIAGLGIAGFTIGFALQDITRNFVAGVLLLLQQPFDISDTISVAGYTGTVLDITTRATTLKTYDGEKVIIPNADIYTNPIINYSDLPLRRRQVTVGLGYGEDVDRAVQVFLKAIQGIDGVASDPAPSIFIKELGASALQLVIYFWVNQRTHNLSQVHSAVVKTIKEMAEKQHIDLPYPTQVVRLEQVPLSQ